MAQVVLILVILAGHLYALMRSVPEISQLFLTAVSANLQTDPPLTRDQIDGLLRNNFDDKNFAYEIRTRGIAFRIDSATWDSLIKLGLGPLTRQELLLQEEH